MKQPVVVDTSARVAIELKIETFLNRILNCMYIFDMPMGISLTIYIYEP